MLDIIFELRMSFCKKYARIPNIVIIPISKKHAFQDEAHDKVGYMPALGSRERIFDMEIAYDVQDGKEIRVGFIIAG